MAEELALEQLLRQGRAGDVHERLRRPIAGVVDDLGHEILAGAALAGEQHGRRGTDRDPGDEMAERGNRRRGTDDPLQAVRPGSIGPELPHFAPQPRRFERALDGRGDLVQVERLVGEVVRPELHRLDGSFDAGVRRQEDDEDVLVELLRLAQDGDAVGIGQPIVEKNQVDAFRKFVQGGASRFGFEHVVPFGLEALGQATNG